MLPPRRPRRPSRRALVLVAVVLCAGVLTACDPATIGMPCAGGVAHDATYVLGCRDGRWTPVMTVQEYLRIASGGTNGATGVPDPAIPIVAVGDIARCGGDHPKVADLLAGQPGQFL